jgi:hypothetical protein
MSAPTPFDRPPYDVIAVFDPDGEEPSFAYTTGVFEAYGLPELFVWAVPDAGVDPGEQWLLSTSDQHTQLSDAVQRIRDGAGDGVRLLLDLLEDSDEGLRLCVASLEIASAGGTRSAFAELDAVARTAGRGPWVTRAKADVDARLTAFQLRVPVEEREELAWDLGTAFRCAATAWVVADLVDDELFRRATASVRAGITRCAAPEDEEPAPQERMAQATQLAADLASGRVRRPPEHEVTLEGLRAIWLMAWTGRGQALMEAVDLAGASELLEDDRVWELLAAALVLDVAPDAVTLLPPQHRAA